MLAPGDTFAGYTVVRELGSGGMGAVYLVRHPRLPRLDALKVLRRELCTDVDFTRRFLREAEVVAGLTHRNVVHVLDRGEDDGQLWLSMQYVEGSDAEVALAAAGGRFPKARAVHVVAEVAAALDAAHRQGLVHRDVKPANILLRPADDGEGEQVFLTDFGIAKPLEAGSTRLTRTGMVIATFDYASPEQVEARPLSSRSDVYSLGCVLYRLLAGRVPFPGETLFAALHGHISLPPPRPSDSVPALPPALDDVVARAMAKDPADRFPTCRALAMAAKAALTARSPEPQTVIQRVTESTIASPPPPTAPRTPTLPAVHYSTPIGHAEFVRAGPTTGAPPGEWSPAGGRGWAAAPPPDERPRSHRRAWLVAATIAALVAAVAVAVAVVLSDRDQDGVTGAAGQPTSTTSSGSSTPAQAAFAALPRGVDPLPDTSVVVVRRDETGVNLFAVDSTNGDALQLTAGSDQATSPILSPDRRTIAFLSAAEDGTTSLLALSTDGGAAQPLIAQLPDDCVMPLRPAWNPVDPTRIALTCRAPDDRRTLRIVTLDGAALTTLDVGPYFGDVAFSPDGTELVYWVGAGPGLDGGSLWTIPADGSATAQQLTDSAGDVDADADWSTGGIVFRRVLAEGVRSICTVRPDGTNLRVLTQGHYDEDPSWSPDGTGIAFKRDGDGSTGLSQIWTMAADGADLAQLGEGPDDLDEPSAPAWGSR